MSHLNFHSNPQIRMSRLNQDDRYIALWTKYKMFVRQMEGLEARNDSYSHHAPVEWDADHNNFT